jgi:hypothetical protein
MIVVKRAQADAQSPLLTETMNLVDVKISVWETLTDGDVAGATKLRRSKGEKMSSTYSRSKGDVEGMVTFGVGHRS